MKFFFKLFLLFFSVNINAQNLHYFTYDASSRIGLTTNAINDIIIDNNHFIWLATDKGLFKFDEKYFIRINGIDEHTNVIKLQYDNDKIFCLTNDAEIFEVQKNVAKKLDVKFNLKHKINDFCLSKDGQIFGMEDKIYSFKNDKFQIYENLIIGHQLLYVKKANKWVNKGSEGLNLVEISNESWFNQPNQIITSFKVNNNYYFYKKNKSNFVFKYLNGKLQKFELPHIIENLFEDSRGNVWVTMVNNVLMKYDQNFRFGQLIKNKIKGKVVGDEFGNIWFGSNNKGLLKFFNTRINVFPINEAENLKNLYFLEDNKAYLETKDDLKQSFNLGSYTLNDKETGVYELNNFVSTLFLNEKKKEFPNEIKLFHNNTVISARTIHSIDNERYMISTSQKVYLLNTKVNEFRVIYQSKSKIKDAFYTDNTLLVSEKKGLKKINLRNNEAQLLHNDYIINCIKKVNSSIILATERDGLLICDSSFNIISNQPNFIKLNGSSIPIKGLDVLKNKIFVYTSSGIFELLFEKKVIFKNYFSETNGLPQNDIEQIQVFNNRLYGINKNHFFVFDLLNQDLNYNATITKPTLESIRFGKTEVIDFENINVDYNDGPLQIKISSPFLINSSRLEFKYKFEGIDEDWQISQDGLIDYFDYGTGNQKIEYYASLDSDIKKSEVNTLNFYVSQPIWQKGWFRALFYTLILGLILGSVVVYYFAKLKELQHEKQVVEYQQKALRAQINPHFLFNALNSIQNFALKNDVVQLSNYIEKFASLTRAILNHSENEFITLSQEIKVLENYMDIEKLRFQNFDYQVDIDENIDVDLFYIPALLLQPIVENAIWHGFQNSPRFGELKLCFSNKNEYLDVIIEDNGVGRTINPNKKHKSKGTDLIKTRLNLLDNAVAKFEINDKLADGVKSGTIVNIQLPILSSINLNKTKKPFHVIVINTALKFLKKV